MGFTFAIKGQNRCSSYLSLVGVNSIKRVGYFLKTVYLPRIRRAFDIYVSMFAQTREFTDKSSKCKVCE